MQASYDIVIVGGGMVGATLACALAPHGYRIAVLEAREPILQWPAGEIDVRVSAITRASQRIFERVGAWSRMQARRVSPYREMRVWDATGSGAIHFDCAEIGEENLGYIIENRVIQAALWERMGELDHIERLCPATPGSLEDLGEQIQLGLDDGRILQARLVVGADGARSMIRDMAHIAISGWPYDQTALVANVATEKPHQETAWQRFLPTGPLAFLPLNDGRCSIVWSTTPEQADELIALDERAFLAALEEASGGALGRMLAVEGRAGYPLRLRHAQSYVRPRIALVGDAAHTIHPLAGQGVNLGLLDAAALAEVLLEARSAGKDPGKLIVLRRYERWRKGENLLMMGAMDGFKRLFGSRVAPVRWARNLGLSLTDAAGPLKGIITRRALGLSGDLPRLAAGGRG